MVLCYDINMNTVIKIHNQNTIINQALIDQFQVIFQATIKHLEQLNHIHLRQNDHNLHSEIESYFLKLSYERTGDETNIIYIITKLMTKYLMSHRLIDGNKRLSLMLLVNWLDLCGYHLDPVQNWSQWIINLVKTLSNTKNDNPEIIKAFAIKVAFNVKIDHFIKWNQYDQSQIDHFVLQNISAFNHHLEILKFN